MLLSKPLPSIVPARIAVKVKAPAERSIRQLHPWIFESAIKKQSAEAKPGDLAIIYDSKKNKFLALGFFDPHSPIRIKLLQFKKTANIDQDWFDEKIALARTKRKSLLETDTNSFRLIFGENDGLPGLICDVYDQVAVIKLYSSIWYPYLNYLMIPILKYSDAKTIVLRLSRNLQKPGIASFGLMDGDVLYGELKKEDVIFREHGLKFSANVIKGHKTGYFLDHRQNRKRIGELSNGKTVLDIFSYAGGFTVHALAGGATAVTSLDISRQAQEMARKNVALNELKGTHEVLVADAFKGMQGLIQQGKKFDIVIVDPPSFAKSAADIPQAINSYQRLTKLAIQLVARNGILLSASCSSRVKAAEYFQMIEKILSDAGRKFELLEISEHDVDHPVGFPEGAYLKSGYYKLS